MRLEVLDVSENCEKELMGAAKGEGRYEAGPEGFARDRLLRVLARAAWAVEPCPGNLELCRRAGIRQQSKVTELLGVLRRQGCIAVEGNGPGRARRIAVADPISGRARRTDWSRPAADLPSGADGGEAMGEALAGRRFADATPAEARRWARGTPRGARLARPGRDASPIACALADLRGNPEFDPEPGQ